MSNLEELDLEFVNHNTPIVDGYDLEMNILSYMRKLKKFEFNIHSVIPLDNQVYLPSNEYFQNTFKNFQNNKIISSIDYSLDCREGLTKKIKCVCLLLPGQRNMFLDGFIEI